MTSDSVHATDPAPEHDATGPYIITVTTAERVRPDSPLREGIQTRRAVATLDEARDEAHDHTRRVRGLHGSLNPEGDQCYWPHSKIDALPAEGGTVGPLPDGTVIEVEQIDEDDLYAQAGKPAITYRSPAQRTDLIVAAFNAAQEG